MSNALYYDWINLEGLHHRLVKQLKFCEELIAAKRAADEWHKRHNPSQHSVHLVTQSCNCMWCSPMQRPVHIPEDDQVRDKKFPEGVI